MIDESLIFRDTIVPKSDQLNADDLFAGPMTVEVIGVRRGSKEQPVQILLEGHRPYRPCKSMRRVLIAAWGDNGHDWIGRSMTLFCDPTVKFGGVAVGGIRISHLSHIDGPQRYMLTRSRGDRSPYEVQELKLTYYPEDEFRANLPAWRGVIESGRMTVDDVIQRAEKRAPLTDEQRAEILKT